MPKLTPDQDIRSTLLGLGACTNARLWACEQADLQEAWLRCERPDWLLWSLKALGYDSYKLRLMLCELVRKTPVKDRKLWDFLPDYCQQAVADVEAWCNHPFENRPFLEIFCEAFRNRRVADQDNSIERSWMAVIVLDLFDYSIDSGNARHVTDCAARLSGVVGWNELADVSRCVSEVQCNLIRARFNPFEDPA